MQSRVESITSKPQQPPAASVPVSVIAPRGWALPDFRELWRYRGLLAIFIWRDLKVRYKQTVLGVVWVVLQPLVMTGIYTIFFGYFAHIPSDGVPYAIFVFSGLVLWQFFSRAVGEASTSLVTQQALISKIYFPRLIAPMTSVGSALADFLVLFVWLIGLMFFYGFAPTPALVLAPFFIVLAATIALGVSLSLTALDAHYRDVRYVLGFALQVWYFATPILYAPSLIPERWRGLLLLNPMAPTVQGFRWTVLGDVAPPQPLAIAAAIGLACACLALGLMLFQRTERTIADSI